ncbi:MAG: rhodanese-related sulfurtransferase [Pseudomonadota bacterium]
MNPIPAPIVVCALYRFVTLDDYRALRGPLLAVMEQQGVRGTLLLAREGINGTVAGSQAAITTLLDWLQHDPRLAGLEYKCARTDQPPFRHSRVKLKREIVTMGVADIDPNRVVGTYVAPADWNALISDPGVLVLDTRNDYEVRVGTFRRAVDPGIRTFREFPAFVRTHLDPQRHRRVAMFCTGGIRCEKSTAYLRQQGFEEVYHLQGGILKYLEQVPEDASLWQGECFVFDERVTVDHRLRRGSYALCHACRMPVSAADMASAAWQPGISCPHCAGHHDPQRLARFAERERQVGLADIRGTAHLGAAARSVMEENRARKRLDRERQRHAAALANARHR